MATNQAQAAIKIVPEIQPVEGYNMDLHDRFEIWREISGDSVNQVARKLSRSAGAVSQYINFKYSGDIAGLEKDIRNLMVRKEDLRTVNPETFLALSASKKLWEGMQFCKEQKKMGAAIAPAGSSKTRTGVAFTKKNPGTIFVTADITKRSLSAILSMIAYRENCTAYGVKNNELLDRIVENLKWKQDLLIIDEAHLLSWEGFEAIRTIYDQAKTGIFYLGMPHLYSQMKGKKGYLWDQILSRLAIKISITSVTRDDIVLLADAICPGLPKNCIDFLYEQALEPGRLRVVSGLLDRLRYVSKSEKIPANLQLLKEIIKF